jgi:tellurite resistance protein
MAKVKSVAKTKVKPTKAAKGKGKAKNDASPLAPLTNQSLSQETGAAVRLRYAGQEQAIKGQERASDQAQKNYTNWFGQYRQAVDQATQRSQQYAMDATNAIKGLADSSGQVDSQNRDQMLHRLQQDAATRGATVDPSIAQISTQALASRRAGWTTTPPPP